MPVQKEYQPPRLRQLGTLADLTRRPAGTQPEPGGLLGGSSG
ncbi:lasso RiPP family leader peptide-containing protein [Micromonospora sp. WMMC241]|nr:lasso RiPP family leader peptide-containing protein [Micromonospora sp. WMMC241]MCZ7434816.1 lasso RiPP family leader peptide-containing protein [Micromonospora sp. WMMC241]